MTAVGRAVEGKLVPLLVGGPPEGKLVPLLKLRLPRRVVGLFFFSFLSFVEEKLVSFVCCGKFC